MAFIPLIKKDSELKNVNSQEVANAEMVPPPVQAAAPQTNEPVTAIETKGPDFPPQQAVAFTQTQQQIPQQQQPVEAQQSSTVAPSAPTSSYVDGSNTSEVGSNYNNLPGLNSPLTTKNNDLWSFLDVTQQRGASDLHFSSGYPALLRIDGELISLGTDKYSNEELNNLLFPVLTDAQKDKFEKNKELDFSLQHKTGARFRVNYYLDRGNLAAAFRLIPSKIRTTVELGLPDILNDFAKVPHGLVLVTGPTGSGKSTSIAAMINEINLNSAKHIITVEDPIEYLYPQGKALINQRELDRDTLSWKNALKYTLRQDPDVVLVGEMRDYETIAAAITVAETGHLVFATLHTNSAAQTIDRIIDVFPEHQQAQVRSQLADVIVAVISQRLIPLNNGGRRAVVEIMVGTAAVRNAIREGKTYQIDNIIQTSAESGMIPLEKSLAGLVKSGEVTLDRALEYTAKPEQLKDLLRTT